MLPILVMMSAFAIAPARPAGLGSLPPLRIAGVPLRAARSRAVAPAWLAAPARGAQQAAATPVATGTDAPAGTELNASSAEPEPDLEMLRHRERLTRMHRALGIATWASLLVTEIMGVILAVNQPTWFGPGDCNTGPPTMGTNCLLGSFGSGDGPLNGFHEASAFITVGLYASAGVFALSMPDPEHAASGNDLRARHLRWHERLAIVHLVGMILMPILGVLIVEPGLVGLNFDPNNPSSHTIDDYQAAMRSIHLGVGLVTFGALTTAMLYETFF